MREQVEPYLNVVRLARKPGREEFWKVAKITAAGMLIIGGMGFLVYLLMDVFPRYMVG
ncbi:MAG: Protein translocase subunit SecE [Methanonatronarchaeales archaeon]|nr:Protein translocase subunit SecE [Methanonatronarchaeales archaeon]